MAHQISRRDFLRLAGTGAAVLMIFGCAPPDFGAADQELLKASIAKGSFSADFIGDPTINSVSSAIFDTFGNYPGINSGRVIIADGTEGNNINYDTADASIIPASVIKIVVCNRIYQTHPDLLTPQLADDILHISNSSVSLLLQSQYGVGRSEADLETMVREVLADVGIEALSLPGQGLLQVNMDQLYDYLSSSQFPQVMTDSMRQTSADFGENYGVSDVLAQYVNLDSTPVLFKLGQITDTGTYPETMINTYFFQSGGMTVLGYASGTNHQSVHSQMLATAAIVGRYIAHRQDLTT